MRILSNGAVAIANADAAHGRAVGGVQTEIEGGRILGVGPGAIFENPGILTLESRA